MDSSRLSTVWYYSLSGVCKQAICPYSYSILTRPSKQKKFHDGKNHHNQSVQRVKSRIGLGQFPENAPYDIRRQLIPPETESYWSIRLINFNTYCDSNHVPISHIPQHAIEYLIHTGYKMSKGVGRQCVVRGGRSRGIKTDRKLHTPCAEQPILPCLSSVISNLWYCDVSQLHCVYSSLNLTVALFQTAAYWVGQTTRLKSVLGRRFYIHEYCLTTRNSRTFDCTLFHITSLPTTRPSPSNLTLWKLPHPPSRNFDCTPVRFT